MIEHSTARVANFNAGPAAMPQVVSERMQAEMLDYHGRGLSVLEMSHRSADFADIAAVAEKNFRQLLDIPEGYSVLFMQVGASAQFSLCVQNLDIRGQVAYADTGYWSHKAMDSARALSRVNEVVHCQKEPLIKMPDSNQWADCESASFLHVTDNETIDGIVLHEVPDRGVPLVCDMSSSILSQPVDIKRYRSRMNIPFQLTNEALTKDFLDGATSRGFVGLKGHKSVGGLRASLYNAVTDRAVDALVDYLNLFAEQHA